MSKEKNIKLSKEDLETLRGYQKKQSQLKAR